MPEENEKSVPQEQVSEEKTVPQEAEKKTEEQPKEQPLTEERVQQLVTEATSRAVAEAKEVGRRELQSQQSINKNAETRARLAESRAKGYEAGLSGLDEETRKDIELARYRETERTSQSIAQEDEQRRQGEAYLQQMNNSLLEEVRSWGIEPDDKRIDFASDAPDYFTGRKRFTDSLQKIVRENQKKAEEKQGEDFKNLESKLRKDLGLDSVDTTAGGSGGSDSDVDFKKGIGDGSLPLNKINMERARRLGLI
ncbi:MAG: hypothetical protein E3J66_02115 [Dehalococcoidia bacterium]|nr:MAG: hypothetical protein E3J66_02115 [Dehalococcoidia bacterium]